MAKLGGGRLVKILDISNYTAECIWFDSRGNIHLRDYDVGDLRPFWLSATPRSLWPEVTDLPDSVVAAMEAQTLARRAKRTHTKRLSNKIKRQRGKTARSYHLS